MALVGLNYQYPGKVLILCHRYFVNIRIDAEKSEHRKSLEKCTTDNVQKLHKFNRQHAWSTYSSLTSESQCEIANSTP